MVLIFGIAFIASLFATVAGFGSATILTPFMSLVIPLKQAIVLVAFFHGASNLSKTGFFRKSIDKRLFLIYGLPSAGSAFIGAQLLHYFNARPLSLIFAVFLLAYSAYSLFNLDFSIPESRKTLVTGGLISGFTGGLIGLGGAVRSVFLISTKIDKKTYIATSAAIAVIVDVTRVSVYLYQGALRSEYFSYIIPLVVLAFFGVFTGKRFLVRLETKLFKRIVLGAIMAVSLRLLLS